MLKKNLIAIIVAMVGLLMVSSAFAQGNVRGPRPSKTNPQISRNDIPKPIHAEVNEVMIDGMIVWGNEVTITGGPHDNSSQRSRTSKPQPKGMNKADLTEQLSINSPRDVASGQATGKRQHKPVKNLGDTGTHEVGHKQKKK